MAEDEKKEKEEVVDPIIVDENNKKPKKKKEDRKKAKEKDRLKDEEIEKEMQQMLDDLSEQMGVDKRQIKVVSMKLPKRDFKFILLETIYYCLLNCAIILGLSGYITWCTGTLLELVYFALTYTAIELVLRNLIYIFLKKTVVQSFGIILLLASFISMLICPFLTFLPHPVSALSYILIMIILLLVREALRKYILELVARIKAHKNSKGKK